MPIGNVLNLPAVLQSPLLGATAYDCKMTFNYHQSYPVAGNPIIFKVSLFRRASFNFLKQLLQITTQVMQWTTYTVPIGSLPAGYQIQIQGMGFVTENTSPYADMEIDEIKFINCGPNSVDNPLTCDFETGTCGWFDLNLSSNNQIDWV